MQPIIVDAHEDLAWNVLIYGRDYTRPVAETRRLEKGSETVAHNGETLLGWDAYQQGRVALVFGTLFAPPRKPDTPAKFDHFYATPDEAYAIYSRQLDIYHRLTDEHPDKFTLVTNRTALDAHLARWQDAEHPHPVGIVPLMEGADGIRNPAELPEWWQRGLRLIGLAWAGTRYSGGTREPGPLTPAGRELLAAMAEFPFILDLSHMDPLSARQALDIYEGPIIASHANPAALLTEKESNRHLPDDVIKNIIARDGVIGTVFLNAFLKADWQKSDGKQAVTLETVANHIDYICQMAGSARHVGLGSDFDGGFGRESAPAEIDTIADLQRLGAVLSARGYGQADIAAILGGNWLRILKTYLPEND